MRTMLLIAIWAGFLSVAEAACGGGGYKQPAVKRSEVAPPVVTVPAAPAAAVTPPAPVASDRADIIEVVSARPADTADIKVSSDFRDLHLTPAQQREAEKIAHDVQARHAQLEQDVARAKQQLDQCKGDCGAELARHKTLSAQLNAFSISSEMKTRVYAALGICEVPPRRSQPGQDVATR